MTLEESSLWAQSTQGHILRYQTGRRAPRGWYFPLVPQLPLRGVLLLLQGINPVKRLGRTDSFSKAPFLGDKVLPVNTSSSLSFESLLCSYPSCPVPRLQMSPWGPSAVNTTEKEQKSALGRTGQTTLVTVHILHQPHLAWLSFPLTLPPLSLKTGWGPFFQGFSWGLGSPVPINPWERERETEVKGVSMGEMEKLS